jgi:hypothetical protein
VAARLSGDGEPRSASKLHWIDELRVSGSFLDSRDHEMRELNTVSKSFWVMYEFSYAALHQETAAGPLKPMVVVHIPRMSVDRKKTSHSS